MGKFHLRRMLWLIPVILVVSTITFILMHAAPGGPWDRDLSARQVDPSTQNMLNDYYGLDKPLWRQYMAYLIGDVTSEGKFDCGLICGDLGPSYRQRGMSIQQVLFRPPEEKSIIYSRFGYSMRLGLYSLMFAIILGIPAGVLLALQQNTMGEFISLFIVTIGISVPHFVVAVFLIIFF